MKFKRLNKLNKRILINDIEAVIESLEMKKKYLKEEKLPSSLNKENFLDEDINYLKEILSDRVKELIV